MIDFKDMNPFQLDVRRRQSASFGAIKIASRDHSTVLRQLRDCLRGRMLTWSTARGLWETKEDHRETPLELDSKDPFDRAATLRDALKEEDAGTLVLFDFDVYIEEDPRIRRYVVEAVHTARSAGNFLILLSRNRRVHDELADEMQVLVHELPDRTTLRNTVNDVLDGEIKADEIKADVEPLLDVLGGLTSTRAADAVSLGVVDALLREAGEIDQKVVRAFKEHEIAKMPGLTLAKTKRRFADIVGYEALKRYLVRQRHSLDPNAREHGVDLPKGVMFVGEPGTGKSVTAEAFAEESGWLLFKLDAGSLRGRYVGDTEENTDKALAVISANTPCVLLIDEVERFFGTSEGEQDGGVGERLTGKILSWAAEQKGAFLIFTSNDPSRLPAALVRKGRLDAFFHIGTPDEAQREAIWRYYFSKADHNLSDNDVNAFVLDSNEWVGSEIEAAVGQARKTAWAAYCEGERDNPYPTADDVRDEVNKTIPHAVTYAEQVKKMRDWASSNALAANDSAQAKKDAAKAADNKPKKARRISV